MAAGKKHAVIFRQARTRRFDSRFFVADAAMVANLDTPLHAGSGELLTLNWFTHAETLGLDLPLITVDILARLKPFLDRNELPAADCPASFQLIVARPDAKRQSMRVAGPFEISLTTLMRLPSCST